MEYIKLIVFKIGQIVYLKTDDQQLARMVIAIEIKQGSIAYCLSQGTTTSWHYEIEMTEEKDIVKSLN
jgi:hypothetical protein